PATIDTCVSGSCHYVPEFQLQDAISAGVLAGWRYRMSEKASIGLGFAVDAVLYDNLPDVAIESLGVVGEYAFGRFTTLSYVAGASVTTSDNVNSTDLAGSVILRRNITEESTLLAGVRQDVSHGSGIGGVALDTGAYVSYQHLVTGPGITG